MKAEEYRENRKEYTTKQFNIKGNPENKATIKSLVDGTHIKNEGEALDFIILQFQESQKPNPAIPEGSQLIVTADFEVLNQKAATVDSLTSDLASLREEFANDKALLEEKASRADKLLENPLYLAFKEDVEKVIPMLFKDATVAAVPISDSQLLEMLVDYAHKDPSKQFPFREVAEKVYKAFKQENGGEQGQGDNTTGGTK